MERLSQKRRSLRWLLAVGVAASTIAAAHTLHLDRRALRLVGLDSPSKTSVQGQLYHCPMHPSYIAAKPGVCPICGMTLVPMKEAPPEASQMKGRAIVTAEAGTSLAQGIVLGKADRSRFTQTIRTSGRVEVDERLIAVVNLKFSGWVQRLVVSALGDTVQKGSPLFEIYSPDLLEAQRTSISLMPNGSAPDA